MHVFGCGTLHAAAAMSTRFRTPSLLMFSVVFTRLSRSALHWQLLPLKVFAELQENTFRADLLLKVSVWDQFLGDSEKTTCSSPASAAS